MRETTKSTSGGAITRRTLVTAAAWATPAIALATALPRASASLTGYDLAVVSPVVASDEESFALVTFPAGAFPNAVHYTRVTAQRISGTHGYSSFRPPTGWTFTSPTTALITFIPPTNPALTGHQLGIRSLGPAVWSLTLTAEHGSITRTMEFLGPVD